MFYTPSTSRCSMAPSPRPKVGNSGLAISLGIASLSQFGSSHHSISPCFHLAVFSLTLFIIRHSIPKLLPSFHRCIFPTSPSFHPCIFTFSSCRWNFSSLPLAGLSITPSLHQRNYALLSLWSFRHSNSSHFSITPSSFSSRQSLHLSFLAAQHEPGKLPILWRVYCAEERCRQIARGRLRRDKLHRWLRYLVYQINEPVEWSRSRLTGWLTQPMFLRSPFDLRLWPPPSHDVCFQNIRLRVIALKLTENCKGVWKLTVTLGVIRNCCKFPEDDNQVTLYISGHLISTAHF